MAKYSNDLKTNNDKDLRLANGVLCHFATRSEMNAPKRNLMSKWMLMESTPLGQIFKFSQVFSLYFPEQLQLRLDFWVKVRGFVFRKQPQLNANTAGTVAVANPRGHSCSQFPVVRKAIMGQPIRTKKWPIMMRQTKLRHGIGYLAPNGLM